MNIETPESEPVRLTRLVAESVKKIKGSLSLRVEYRVHGGNQANELIDQFKNNSEETLNHLIIEFVAGENLNDEQITKLKPLLKAEIEKLVSEIEQEAYQQLRNYIDNRYTEINTTARTKQLVPDTLSGNDIYLLSTDRALFERHIKAHFLDATGPLRSN